MTDGFGNITVLLKGLPWLLEASHFNWESLVDDENSWSIPREKKKRPPNKGGQISSKVEPSNKPLGSCRTSAKGGPRIHYISRGCP